MLTKKLKIYKMNIMLSKIYFLVVMYCDGGADDRD